MAYHSGIGFGMSAIATVVAGLCTLQTAAQATLVDDNLAAETVAENLGNFQLRVTTAFVFIDEDTILGVNRRDGEVYRLDLIDGQIVEPGPVIIDLDIIAPSQSDIQTEYGVQAMTLHPDFANNGYVYIRYDKSLAVGKDTPQNDVTFMNDNFSGSELTDNVIERYIWDAANGGSLTFDQQIYQTPVDTRYHHGGPMRFGPDGKLYAIYGELRRDGGGGWRTQTAGALYTANRTNGVVEDNGTIIRINDDGTLPPDNPIDTSQKGVPAQAAAWFAFGVRNSFGLAFDPVTGNLWDTENGEALYDEVNLVQPGFNSGWRWIMGPEDHPFQTGSTDNLINLSGSAYSDPEFSWLDTFGITAINFLHGSTLGPAYDDIVLVGMINNGFLFGLELNPARTGFVFDTPGLQDLVDDRDGSNNSPIGTEGEETLFGEGFGAFAAGILAIELSPAGVPYILSADGDLRRIIRVTETATLTLISTSFGSELGGGLADVLASDDSYYRARSAFGFLSSEPNVLDVRIIGNVTNTSPSTMTVLVESRLNNPAGLAKLRLRNFDTNALEQVDTFSTGTAEAVAESTINPADDYVRDSDGQVELSVRTAVIATFSLSGFIGFYDQIEIQVD